MAGGIAEILADTADENVVLVFETEDPIILAEEMWNSVGFASMFVDFSSGQVPEANGYLQNVHSGSILLFHDGGKGRQKTINALPKIIEKAKEKNLTFLKVSEILP